MINYDKARIKESLDYHMIFSLLEEFGGEPVAKGDIIISRTICHNKEQGSFKLYYYNKNQLFYCYSNCGSYDIFQLIINVAKIQWQVEFDLDDAVRWIARRFGIIGEFLPDEEYNSSPDWLIFERYNQIQEIKTVDRTLSLKEYNPIILDRFNYNVRITPWENDHIAADVLRQARIGYYPGGNQITIPHFDKDGRFIGLRGRSLCEDEADTYGKYRPLRVGRTQYNHPLSFNLYNLNNTKENIRAMSKAIIFESEKATLQYASYFGWENNIAVACCGSNISLYQMDALIQSGAKEVVIAFDRQFLEIDDNEHKKLVSNFMKIHQRYKNDVNLSFMFDRNKITGYKDSPTDQGPEKFLKLFKERVTL